MLINKIENKTAKVGVIGLGYVGLPLAVGFAKAGFSVTGIDIDKNRVDRINSGENYISDVDSFDLASLVKSDVFNATFDFCPATIVAGNFYKDRPWSVKNVTDGAEPHLEIERNYAN